MTLLDNGAQINTIMPKYISDHSLHVGSITNLLGAKVVCIGLGNTNMRPLGYIIIQVQVDGVQGYDEDQIALVIPDLSNFVAQIPVILGTPIISCIVNVMKETEINALAMPCANARVAHLLSVHRMIAIKVGDSIVEESSSDAYNQVMFTQNVETRSLLLLHGAGINIMTQALQTEDGSLLQGLTVQNTYTELSQGSKESVMVVRNSTAYPQTLQKKTPVARAVVVIQLPEPPMEAQLQKGDEPLDPHTPKLTVRQRDGKLFDELDFSGLDSWTLELSEAANWLNTMMCFPWTPWSWAVLTLLNT